MLFREKTVALRAEFIKLYFISLHVTHKDISIETFVYRCNFLTNLRKFARYNTANMFAN